MKDFSDLARDAQAGSDSAQATLLRNLDPLFRGFFLKRIGSRPEVDDLVQNSLVRVHRGLPDLKDPDRLKGFAMKAALFELQDYYRGRYTGKEMLFEPIALPEHQQLQPASALSIDLERAMARLSDRAREIMELKAYGYRYEEIAEMIGSTEAAIKMQVKRAIAKLRELLGAIILILNGLSHLTG